MYGPLPVAIRYVWSPWRRQTSHCATEVAACVGGGKIYQGITGVVSTAPGAVGTRGYARVAECLLPPLSSFPLVLRRQEGTEGREEGGGIEGRGGRDKAGGVGRREGEWRRAEEKGAGRMRMRRSDGGGRGTQEGGGRGKEEGALHLAARFHVARCLATCCPSPLNPLPCTQLPCTSSPCSPVLVAFQPSGPQPCTPLPLNDAPRCCSAARRPLPYRLLPAAV